MSASKVPIRVWELRSQATARMNVSAKAKIDKELLPILKNLQKANPDNYMHPVSKKVLKWLVHKHRTADEFNYVIGPLGQHVLDMAVNIGYGLESFESLGMVAAEALAFKCPIIDGSWGVSALLVFELCKGINFGEYGFASDHLSTWIIHTIGDPNLCPDPELRAGFMCLLSGMVQINDQNRKMAFQSLMFAYESLDHSNRHLGPSIITRTLEMFAGDRYLYEIDQRLSEKLQDIKSLRLSDMLYDVSYEMRLNPNRYTEPNELYSLTALLKTTSGYAQTIKCCIGMGIFLEITQLLKAIVYSFETSCQMPQVIEVTASCVIEVMELIIGIFVSFPLDKVAFCCVNDIEAILQNICNENDPHTVTTSPVGKEIIRKYQKRLTNLGHRLMSTKLYECPTILNLVYFG